MYGLLQQFQDIDEKIHWISFLILHCLITTWFFKTASSTQHAHSTQHAINYLHEKFVQALDNKEHVVAVFLDVSKAFDTVNHEIVLCKFQKYGVRGVTSDFFHSYLSNRFQFTKFVETESSRINIICGVPQGSILGPLLFLLHIYLKPLPSKLHYVQMTLAFF